MTTANEDPELRAAVDALLPVIPPSVTTGPDGASLGADEIAGVRRQRAWNWAFAGHRDPTRVAAWLQAGVLDEWAALIAERRGYRPGDPWVPTGFLIGDPEWSSITAGVEPQADRAAARRNRREAQRVWDAQRRGSADHRRSRPGQGPPDPRPNQRGAAAAAEFVRGAVFPELVTVLLADGPPPAPPPVLVVAAPDRVVEHDPVFRALRHAYAADKQGWFAKLVGAVGWQSQIELTGDAEHDRQYGLAKVVMNLVAPVQAQAEFVFHLAQSMPIVQAVVGTPSLFGIGTAAQLDYITAQQLNYDDALELLTVVPLAPAPQLAATLRLLSGPGS